PVQPNRTHRLRRPAAAAVGGGRSVYFEAKVSFYLLAQRGFFSLAPDAGQRHAGGALRLSPPDSEHLPRAGAPFHGVHVLDQRVVRTRSSGSYQAAHIVAFLDQGNPVWCSRNARSSDSAFAEFKSHRRRRGPKWSRGRVVASVDEPRGGRSADYL